MHSNLTMLFDAISQLNQQYAKQKASQPLAKRATRRRTQKGSQPTIHPKITKKASQLQLRYNNRTTLDRRGQLKKMVAMPAKI